MEQLDRFPRIVAEARDALGFLFRGDLLLQDQDLGYQDAFEQGFFFFHEGSPVRLNKSAFSSPRAGSVAPAEPSPFSWSEP
jgi:hypothetical protein